MNYSQTTASASALLGNAIFLSLINPVRIVAYDEYAEPAVVTRVNDVIASIAAARNRTYVTRTISVAADMPAELNLSQHDVVLVYDQPLAAAGTLATIGASWAAGLDAFAAGGGTVVALSSATGVAQMDDLMTSGGLLDVSDLLAKPSGQLYNNAPGDAIGLGVVSPFAVRRDTCTFQTSATPGPSTVFVVTDADPAQAQGNAVVVHRIR
jgi:hypothetical protein